MTYRAGLGLGMAKLGFTPGPPHVFCDTCGCRRSAETKSGGPAAWLLKRKAPPGWLLIRSESNGEISRLDYCPHCKAAVAI